MDRLVAKAVIQETLYRLAYAEHELDRAALQDLFIPNQTFPFDVSSHVHSIPPIDTTPDELVRGSVSASRRLHCDAAYARECDH